ncbi:hypothetical protein LCGC14_2727410, partial [marine sediment metagenome]
GFDRGTITDQDEPLEDEAAGIEIPKGMGEVKVPDLAGMFGREIETLPPVPEAVKPKITGAEAIEQLRQKKKEKQDVTQAKREVVRPERERETARRAVPDEGRGAEAVSAGGALQKQAEGVKKPDEGEVKPVAKEEAFVEPSMASAIRPLYDEAISTIPDNIKKEINVVSIRRGEFPAEYEGEGGRLIIDGKDKYHVVLERGVKNPAEILKHELLHAYILKHPELQEEGYLHGHEDAVEKIVKDTKAGEVTPKGKEPWEMTKQGYINKEADYLADLLDKQGKHKIAARARGDEFRKNYGPDDNPAKWAQIHKKAIQQALKEGKPVSKEVLAEYPDLVKTKPPSPKEKPPEQPVSEPGKAIKAKKPIEIKGKKAKTVSVDLTKKEEAALSPKEQKLKPGTLLKIKEVVTKDTKPQYKIEFQDFTDTTRKT